MCLVKSPKQELAAAPPPAEKSVQEMDFGDALRKKANSARSGLDALKIPLNGPTSALTTKPGNGLNIPR